MNMRRMRAVVPLAFNILICVVPFVIASAIPSFRVEYYASVPSLIAIQMVVAVCSIGAKINRAALAISGGTIFLACLQLVFLIAALSDVETRLR